MGLFGVLTLETNTAVAHDPELFISEAFVVFRGAHFSYTCFWVVSFVVVLLVTVIDWMAERREISKMIEDVFEQGERTELAKKEVQDAHEQASVSSEDDNVNDSLQIDSRQAEEVQEG